ncbi:MAG: hypothetical protein ACI9JL_001032 [Paracoccaceae bacterium]|jgi:hypothetical protein
MRITRRICQSLALPVLLAIAAPVYAAAPLPVESGKEEYVVKRNGSPIGTLKINFKRDGNRLVATSDYSIKVKLLAIVLYRYDKRMVETYENERLVAYETDIDDNGTELQVRITRKDNALSIVHPKGTLTAPLGLYPSTYWPPATIEQTQMIDSSDGVLMNVQTAAAGAENVTIDGRTVSAKRYKMSGDAVRDLWYDAGTGAWLKMKFKGSDNSVIEIERDWPPVWKRDLL